MKKTFGFSVHDIVEIAMLCALSIILDQFLKIRIGSTGGSINLATLPLFIIALRHGPFKGFIAGGVVFGFLSCLLDNYGIITYPLEYFLPFGTIGFLGVFSHFIHKSVEENNKKKIALSYVLILLSFVIFSLIRLAGATIDSMLLWEYEFIPALVYNVTYILPSNAIVLIILCILLPVIIRVNRFIKSSYLKD